MKTYWKIVEMKDGELYFLFHGINGTRKIPRGVWVRGERKENVQDGRGTRYTSGIHIVEGFEEAQAYMRKFRRTDRILIPCYARGLRRKTHSRHKVYLADQIKIL